MQLIFENGQILPFKPINYFTLFDLKPSFGIDEAYIDKSYLNLQKQVHPDKFVNASISQQMHALNWVSLINEAYEVLKSPVKKSVYLLELMGELDILQSHYLSGEMLQQQFVWREMLDDDGNIKALKKDVVDREKEMLECLKNAFEINDIQKAKDATVSLQFITKFKQELKKKRKR